MGWNLEVPSVQVVFGHKDSSQDLKHPMYREWNGNATLLQLIQHSLARCLSKATILHNYWWFVFLNFLLREAFRIATS